MIVSMWTIEVTVSPSSSNVSGSTTHMPVLSFGEFRITHMWEPAHKSTGILDAIMGE
jgi:hypothetical protein